jgi:hypothetical protein
MIEGISLVLSTPLTESTSGSVKGLKVNVGRIRGWLAKQSIATAWCIGQPDKNLKSCYQRYINTGDLEGVCFEWLNISWCEHELCGRLVFTIAPPSRTTFMSTHALYTSSTPLGMPCNYGIYATVTPQVTLRLFPLLPDPAVETLLFVKHPFSAQLTKKRLPSSSPFPS